MALFVQHEGRRLGFEFKYTDEPRLTKSMRIAMEDLRLDELTLVCPGKVSFPITENIRVKGLELWKAPPALV